MNFSWVKAAGHFVSTFFGRVDPVQSFSENGHSILEGWGSSPEESLITRSIRAKAKSSDQPQACLYGTKGMHEGEWFLLRGPAQTVGVSVSDDVVVTPVGLGTEAAQSLVIQLGAASRILAPEGKSILVNGTQTNSASLYDFDEIEILGNHFLFLDLETAQWKR